MAASQAGSVTTPVGYVRDGDRIVIVTSPTYRWWPNFVGGADAGVPRARGLAGRGRAGGPHARRSALRRDRRISRSRSAVRACSAGFGVEGRRPRGSWEPEAKSDSHREGAPLRGVERFGCRERTMNTPSTRIGRAGRRTRPAPGRSDRRRHRRGHAAAPRRSRLPAHVNRRDRRVRRASVVPALYRRYGSKAELVVAAIAHIASGPEPELPLGQSRGPVRSWPPREARSHRPAAITVLGSLLAEQRRDPELLAAFRTHLFDAPPGCRPPGARPGRGARGDVAPEADLEAGRQPAVRRAACRGDPRRARRPRLDRSHAQPGVAGHGVQTQTDHGERPARDVLLCWSPALPATSAHRSCRNCSGLGARVRVAAWDPDVARRAFGDAVEVVPFDFTRPGDVWSGLCRRRADVPPAPAPDRGR